MGTTPRSAAMGSRISVIIKVCYPAKNRPLTRSLAHVAPVTDFTWSALLPWMSFSRSPAVSRLLARRHSALRYRNGPPRRQAPSIPSMWWFIYLDTRNCTATTHMDTAFARSTARSNQRNCAAQ